MHWKNAEELSKIDFTHDRQGRRIRIGGNLVGNVYIGRIRFNDGSRHRVAIKVFRAPLDEKIAAQYSQTIADLAKAGVRLPKMGMLKHAQEGRIQVSQLFGSTSRGSKISHGTSWNATEMEVQIEVVKQLAKIANAGYTPVADCLEQFKDQKKAIPVDLDSIVVQGKTPTGERAGRIAGHIGMSSTPAYREELKRAALEASSDEMREQLMKVWKRKI